MRLPTTFSALAVVPMFFPPALAIPAKHQSLSRSSLTASQLEFIAPTSNTCAGATYPSECRTAEQALPFILQSFDTYSITSAGAQAAIISTIAFESGDFKYQIHHFPNPVPGQGTRNMQSTAFNAQYATSLQLGTVEQAGPNEILDALISSATYDFGSAAWFLDTQCGSAVKTGLATGGMDGYMAYLTCIGTTMTPDREAYWQRANSAFGIQSAK